MTHFRHLSVSTVDDEHMRCGNDWRQGGWTALHRACRNDQEAVVKVLIEAGADVNLSSIVSSLELSMSIVRLEVC